MKKYLYLTLLIGLNTTAIYTAGDVAALMAEGDHTGDDHEGPKTSTDSTTWKPGDKIPEPGDANWDSYLEQTGGTKTGSSPSHYQSVATDGENIVTLPKARTMEISEINTQIARIMEKPTRVYSDYANIKTFLDVALEKLNPEQTSEIKNITDQFDEEEVTKLQKLETKTEGTNLARTLKDILNAVDKIKQLEDPKPADTQQPTQPDGPGVEAGTAHKPDTTSAVAVVADPSADNTSPGSTELSPEKKKELFIQSIKATDIDQFANFKYIIKNLGNNENVALTVDDQKITVNKNEYLEELSKALFDKLKSKDTLFSFKEIAEYRIKNYGDIISRTDLQILPTDMRREVESLQGTRWKTYNEKLQQYSNFYGLFGGKVDVLQFDRNTLSTNYKPEGNATYQAAVRKALDLPETATTQQVQTQLKKLENTLKSGLKVLDTNNPTIQQVANAELLKQGLEQAPQKSAEQQVLKQIQADTTLSQKALELTQKEESTERTLGDPIENIKNKINQLQSSNAPQEEIEQQQLLLQFHTAIFDALPADQQIAFLNRYKTLNPDKAQDYDQKIKDIQTAQQNFVDISTSVGKTLKTNKSLFNAIKKLGTYNNKDKVTSSLLTQIKNDNFLYLDDLADISSVQMRSKKNKPIQNPLKDQLGENFDAAKDVLQQLKTLASYGGYGKEIVKQLLIAKDPSKITIDQTKITLPKPEPTLEDIDSTGTHISLGKTFIGDDSQQNTADTETLANSVAEITRELQARKQMVADFKNQQSTNQQLPNAEFMNYMEKTTIPSLEQKLKNAQEAFDNLSTEDKITLLQDYLDNAQKMLTANSDPFKMFSEEITNLDKKENPATTKFYQSEAAYWQGQVDDYKNQLKQLQNTNDAQKPNPDEPNTAKPNTESSTDKSGEPPKKSATVAQKGEFSNLLSYFDGKVKPGKGPQLGLTLLTGEKPPTFLQFRIYRASRN